MAKPTPPPDMTPKQQKAWDYAVSLIPADKLGEAPIDLAKVQQPPSDEITGVFGTIYDKSAGITDEVMGYRERIAKMEAEAEKERKGALGRMKEIALGKPRVDTVAEQKKMFAEYGIPEYFEKLKGIEPEITSLRERLAKLNAAEQEAMLGVEQIMQGRLTSSLRGEQSLIERKYAAQRAGISAELAAKLMTAEMYRGNIALARGLVSDVISAMTFDIKMQRQDMDDLYNYYRDELSTLDTASQREISAIRRELEREEDRQREDYQAKLNLMLEAGLSWSPSYLKERSLAELTAEASPMIAAGAPGKVIPGEEPLSISDIKRYREMSPDAGIMPGDTESEANEKVWLHQEFRPIIRQAREGNTPKETFENTLKETNNWDAIPSNVQAIIDEEYLKPPEEKGGGAWGRFWSGVYHRLPFVK